MAWTLYRVVKNREPTLLDFMSNEVQGTPLRSEDPEVMRLWGGISCWASEAQARRAIRSFPRLGSHIATLQIPDDAPVRVERTRGPGHHTIWGDPATLLTHVASVVLA